MSLYDDLGVSKDAPPDEIKKAYKAKAQKEHPDRPGGDHDRFQAISQAYSVLSDPDRRKRYDETGQEKFGVEPPEQKALTVIAQVFLQSIDSGQVEHRDLVKLSRQTLKQILTEANQQKARGEKIISSRQKAMARVCRKDGKQNVIADLIAGDIQKHQQSMATLLDQVEVINVALGMLDDYIYSFDQPSRYQSDSLNQIFGQQL
jgi:curved DNA-binding protein CbpA